MRIRPGTGKDLEAWLSLRLALWPETPEAQHRVEMADILADSEENGVVVCEEDGGRLVGFAEVSLRKWAEGCLSSPVGYLEGWYVAEEARRRGVGGQLVRAAEDWARAKGCSEMASDTGLDNAVSEAAHQRLGYEVVGRVICFRKELRD
jgi:aminoglycoside 6'-N-acetyltransferase I